MRYINRKTMELGQKAEKLIEDMLKDLGFTVVRFGYEHLFPQFADINNLLRGRAGQLIRAQPDFIIVNPKDNRAYFIEVKYRSDEILDDSVIKAIYPDMYTIMVSPHGILIANNEYMDNNPDHEDCFCYLPGIGPFNKSHEQTIIRYVRKAKEIFGWK